MGTSGFNFSIQTLLILRLFLQFRTGAKLERFVWDGIKLWTSTDILFSIRANKLKFCGWSYSRNIYLMIEIWGLIKLNWKFVTSHRYNLMCLNDYRKESICYEDGRRRTAFAELLVFRLQPSVEACPRHITRGHGHVWNLSSPDHWRGRIFVLNFIK